MSTHTDATLVHWGEIFDYFVNLSPARLVVTGGPGSGKSTLIAELCRSWLIALDDDTDRVMGTWKRRIPLRVPASSWSGQSISEWICDELVQTYSVQREAAEGLVSDRRIVPVIDGVDELDLVESEPKQAARLLSELNAYRDRNQEAPMVVACRESVYRRMIDTTSQLRHANVVSLDPIAPPQVIEFLQARDDAAEWAPIIEILREQPAGSLATLLSVPWRLTLAVAAYGDGTLDLSELCQDVPDELDNYLLSRFPYAVTDRENAKPGRRFRPRSNRVHHWLQFLAQFLNEHGGREDHGRVVSRSDLRLEEMWLATGSYSTRCVDAAITSMVTMVIVIAWSGFHFRVGQLVIALLVGLVGLIPWSQPRSLYGPLLNRERGIFSLVLVRIGLTMIYVTLYCAICILLAAFTYAVLAVAIGSIGFLAFAPPLLVAYAVAELIRPGLADTSWYGLVLLGTIVTSLLIVAILGRFNVFRSPARRVHRAVAAQWELWSDRLTAALVLPAVWLGRLWRGDPWILSFRPTVEGDVNDPIKMISNDSTVSVACLFLSVSLFFVAGQATRQRASWWGLLAVVGIFCFALGAFRSGRVSRRYIAMLICCRGKLPWRLGRFMDWANKAGLLKLTGTAYQFRHQELVTALSSDHGVSGNQ